MISTLLIPWIPTLVVWMAIVLQELSLPFEAWSIFRPDLVLISLFYWRLYRSDLCGPILAFCTGLLLDLLAGTPLGLNAFSKVIMILLIGSFGIRLRAAEFLHLLPVMLILVVVDQSIQLLFVSLLLDGDFYLPLFLGRPVATMLVMPAVVFVLIFVHRSWLEYR
ncbi:MAG: rod shape-determining protein MreD [Magnetococcales bacterium]|nr:rod shape-determining protein MreD [Magnetococcales bacterium]